MQLIFPLFLNNMLKSETADFRPGPKRSAANLYTTEEEEEEDELLVPPQRPNEYGFDPDEEEDAAREDDSALLRAEQEMNDQALLNELLFSVQGVGAIKDVDGVELFVKGQHCEDAMKDIHRFLKRENPERPVVRLELAAWNFLEQQLLPLLVTQKQDKKLSFLTTLLLVDLTQFPNPALPNPTPYMDFLRRYKEAFLAPNIVNTLMLHLADILQQEEKARVDKQN